MGAPSVHKIVLHAYEGDRDHKHSYHKSEEQYETLVRNQDQETQHNYCLVPNNYNHMVHYVLSHTDYIGMSVYKYNKYFHLLSMARGQHVVVPSMDLLDKREGYAP